MARNLIQKTPNQATTHDYVHDTKNFVTKSFGAFMCDLARHIDHPLTPDQCDHNKRFLRELSAELSLIGDDFFGKRIYERIDDFASVYHDWNKKDAPPKHRLEYLSKLKKKACKLSATWRERVYRIEQNIDFERAKSIHGSVTKVITSSIESPISILSSLSELVGKIWKL